GRAGIFHDVPDSLPALLYARKVQRRAAAIDFEYPDTAGALADLDDELRELKHALAEADEIAPETEPPAHVSEEMGDVLFAAVNVARRLNVDPELALRTMSRRFIQRVDRTVRGRRAARRQRARVSRQERSQGRWQCRCGAGAGCCGARRRGPAGARLEADRARRNEEQVPARRQRDSRRVARRRQGRGGACGRLVVPLDRRGGGPWAARGGGGGDERLRR